MLWCIPEEADASRRAAMNSTSSRTAEADITSWLSYFLKGMATLFESVARKIRGHSLHPDEKAEHLPRKLDRRARIVLGLFSHQEEITSNDVARVLGLSACQAREVLNEWLEAGWFEVSLADTA